MKAIAEPPVVVPGNVCCMTGQQIGSKCDIDYTKVSKATMATKTIQSNNAVG